MAINYGTYDKEHRHFGGIIYSSDFNTDFRGDDTPDGSYIAKRIESDFRWERKMFQYYEKLKRRKFK